MRRSWMAACSAALCIVLMTGQALTAQGVTRAPDRISQQNERRYQQQVARIERVARRLLEAIPQPPPAGSRASSPVRKILKSQRY